MAARLEELSQYDDLNTERGRSLFIVLVVEYMRYLKSGPARLADWDEPTEMEMEMARKLLRMIDHDRAWPFARQVVQDFRTLV
ncbi:hypothetical protein PV04_03047 [Phialophora macrospora]|uniref:Uncharacterized protein n=1 Tax=Phialophora macrospora TaxID=1851006 RepID=A0A0D2FWE6_9EURO|nr:hypothetical protein PV04_03047 [Phialophora macrospora]